MIRPDMNWLKRILTPPLIVIAALLMWCEEWLWIRLKWLTGLVARFPLIRWYESLIVRLPPYPMLIVFLLPGLLLLPVKLLAVYWLTRGYWLLSLALIAAAKVLGTAIVARSYVVCHATLMTIPWFRWMYDWLVNTRNMLYAAIQSMPWYQAVRQKILAIKHWLHQLRRRWRGRRGLWSRWKAIRRLHRMRRRKGQISADQKQAGAP